MSERRYCIGCIHWSFEQGSESQVWSSVTIDEGYPAYLSCDRGHWATLNTDVIMQSDIERAMEKAQTCPDYSERPPPKGDAA